LVIKNTFSKSCCYLPEGKTAKREKQARFGEKDEIKALERCISVRDKMIFSKDGQVLILRTCEYAILFGKWTLQVDSIKNHDIQLS